MGWTEYSALEYELIMMNEDLPVAAHSGQWAVWLGGDDLEISFVSQSVTVTAEASILGYWVWIASDDYCGFDFGSVIVNSTVVDMIDLCDDNDTGGWVRRIVDLGAFVGQNVTLQIRAETDFSINSNMFVDDVTLSSAAAILMRPAPRPHADASGAALPKQLERGEPTDSQSTPVFRLWTPAANPKP